MGLKRKLQSMSDRVVLAALRRHLGTVDDSELGVVEYAAHAAPVRITVTGQGDSRLPPVEIDYSVLHSPCRIGSSQVTIDAGARAIRRQSFTTRATFDGHEYAVRPRWYRSAWFVRDGERLALFRRPRGRSRTARWDSATRVEEQALAHALAAYGGIGAPGAIVNLLGNLP